MIGKILLSSGCSEVVLSGLELLAASHDVSTVYISPSVNTFPLSTLYSGLFIVCTILSTTPLCCGERSGP